MEENKDIAALLHEQARLMEVRGDNPYRARAYRQGGDLIAKLEEPAKKLVRAGKLEEIDGIGDSIGSWVTEYLKGGLPESLQNLRREIPEGIRKMLTISGLGPKKVRVIWQEMGITTLGGLYYACQENRLSQASGFGEKTQEKLLQTLEYLRRNERKFLYADLLAPTQTMEALLRDRLGPRARIALTGEMRRACPVVEKIQFLLGPEHYSDWMRELVRHPDYELKTAGSDLLVAVVRDTQISIEFLFRGVDFYRELFLTTGPETHTERIPLEEGHIYDSEEEIYASARINFVPAVMREGAGEVRMAYRNQVPEVVRENEVKGVLHAHTTWSDGRHSVREMADTCRALGLQYLGLTDHSQSAFYAGGLSPEEVAAQQVEIEALNAEYTNFRILKGIESDILPNGDLDYTPDVLASFDFVIASVHSQLHMSEAKATERLLRAIRNPFTTILGHPTGRLLLARPGYPIDHRRIIEACALYQVAIELNANPNRLDLDWRWIRVAVEAGVMVSINPDAHRKEAITDYKYGIPIAQKGLLPKQLCLNSRSLDEIEEYFIEKKKERLK